MVIICGKLKQNDKYFYLINRYRVIVNDENSFLPDHFGFIDHRIK